jgi:hypothetical protein
VYFGAAAEGEREAAEAEVERLKAKLDEVSGRDPPIEVKFSLPDQWSGPAVHRLVPALWRAAFRYPRQRSTTIMVTAPRRFFETVVWRQLSELHTDL